MKLCLFGASSDNLAEEYFDQVNELGREMGKRKISLVFGGGATGLMGAVCRGAYAEGGEIIGIAPKFFDEDGVLFQQCSEMIFTETMRQRKQLMEDYSDGFIVVPGGIGTFEEFFEIFTLRQLSRHNKPIALLNTKGYYDKLLAFLNHAVSEGFMSRDTLNLIGVFDDAYTLLNWMENQEK